MFLIPATIYLVLCVAVGIWGRRTLIGFWGNFILSIFLSPFVIFVAMLLLAPRRGDHVGAGR